MPKAAAARLPSVSNPDKRLSPTTILSINDGYLLQENVRQLLCGLLHGFQSAHVKWNNLPPLMPGGSTAIETDWVTWKNPVYDYSCTPVASFIDFESSVRFLEDSTEYVAEKILNLKRLVDSPGGIPALVKKLRTRADFQRMPSLAVKPIVFLIFVGNHARDLPDSTAIQRLLQGKKGKLAGSHPGITCRAFGSGGSARLVETESHELIYVGLANREKVLELTYQAIALNLAKRHDLVDERYFHELTALAGLPLLLEPMPRQLSIQAASAPAPVVIDGKHVVYYRFTVDPIAFLRLSTVMRLVSDYDYLQRLPEGPHLWDMATDVEAGGRFPTPVLTIPADDNKPMVASPFITHTGGAILTPYGWHIIDGQHRVFSYYLTDPGKAVQSLDVNSYEPANPTDKPAIASALFLNVNFKALKPPIDLALAHAAFASQWTGGAWIPRKRGRQSVGDSKLYSSRILASRFCLELSGSPSVFKNFFRHRGATDSGKASIQSISTYLGDNFNLREPNDAKSPIASRFGTVAGASGIWTKPNPTPQSIQPLWDNLVSLFDDFLIGVCEAGGGSPVANRETIRDLVLENNNVFVGLWKAFFWYSFEKTYGGKRTPEVPKRLLRQVLPWLKVQSDRGRLSGARNAYRSGSGAVRISDRLVRLLGGP